MNTMETLLEQYGESHQNPTNKLIHWVCIPFIVLSTVGLLWSIPSAYFDGIIPGLPAGLLNWGTILLALAMVYYLVLSRPIFFGLIPFVAAVIIGNYYLAQLPWHLAITSAVIFAIAWVVQFVGHEIEGKKPSFLKDVQFLLIGPAWMISFVLNRMG